MDEIIYQPRNISEYDDQTNVNKAVIDELQTLSLSLQRFGEQVTNDVDGITSAINNLGDIVVALTLRVEALENTP